MIIIKPDWVSHGDARNKRPCIYSVDVHPDGKRLATGSLDGNVKIWNTDPIFDEKAEQDPNCHKLLCTMTMHNGAVLCVRWSNVEGRYLASGSDNDNVIIIWEKDKNVTAGSVFGSSEVNHETWRAVKYLRGHESDVQDLAWSSDNQYLASCGVDGFVIVWNGSTFDQVTKIDQHGGFVKGITWDPAGKYLASQSDDKMVKVWRRSDWALESNLIQPFVNAPGTTLFRRLSWSPDGAHIAAANAVNGIQCIAAIINRDDWNADVSLVGHQLPVEVAAFNPKLFYFKENAGSEKSIATVCALGSQDRSISIWVTKFNRPVCVATDIFDSNVYDIAWTPDGKSLFACSQDGTVACLQLEAELADIAPDEEVYKELTKYGYGRQNTQLPETPIQLELEESNAIVTKASASKRIAELMTGDSSFAPSAPSNNTPITADIPMVEAQPIQPASVPGPSLVLEKQKVTIAKNGKKRIQPTMLSTTSTTPTKSNQLLPAKTSMSIPDNTRHINRQQAIAYDEPVSIPSSGISILMTGNKRKASIDTTEENELNGNKPTRPRPEWIDSAVVPPTAMKSQIRMGLPKVQSVLLTKLLPDDPTVVLECHNQTSDNMQTKVVNSKQGKIVWIDYLPSAVLLMTGNKHFSAVSCEDGSIHVYSPAGRRLLPPMIMESTPVVFQCASQWIVCVTATGLLYTWNIAQMKCALSGISIGPILQAAQLSSSETHKAPKIRDVRVQANGIPVLVTSLQQAFVYHVDMKVWLRISDAWYIISEFWGSGIHTNNPLGWLASKIAISGTDPIAKLMLDMSNTDERTTAVITISHIETQLAVAALLNSPQEYNDWMMIYARKLSEENAKERIEELCRWLMGPPFVSSEFAEWEPKIMDTLLKKDLLKQILPVLAQNRQLQRTVTEFKACL
ncbi:WD40-repeat-containing domain protein [Choanephora cucurbitarum]|nr:WD40-repeat-containing domain protein [Choanephora cucurbitarum]